MSFYLESCNVPDLVGVQNRVFWIFEMKFCNNLDLIAFSLPLKDIRRKRSVLLYAPSGAAVTRWMMDSLLTEKDIRGF